MEFCDEYNEYDKLDDSLWTIFNCDYWNYKSLKESLAVIRLKVNSWFGKWNFYSSVTFLFLNLITPIQMTEFLIKLMFAWIQKCSLSINNMHTSSNVHEQGIIVNDIIPPHNSSIHYIDITVCMKFEHGVITYTIMPIWNSWKLFIQLLN